MASDAAPQPIPPGAAGPDQKHVSALLVISLILSVAGFMWLPIFGPLIGILLAVIGVRRVKKDPMLIGPRLARWSLLVGLVCLVGQAYLHAPGFAFQYKMSEQVSPIIEKMKARDAEGIRDRMPPEWQETHSSEDVKAMLDEAFSGEGPITIPEDGFEIDTKSIDAEALQADFDRMMDDYSTPIRFPIPYLMKQPDGGKASIRLTAEVTRNGYIDFDVRIVDFLVAPGVGPKEEEAAPADEAGAKPEAGDDEAGEATTPEDETPDEPR